MLQLRKRTISDVFKSSLKLCLGHRDVLRTVHADVKEGLQLHLRLVGKNEFLMHLLSLKNLVNFINLNEHFLECHSHGALFKHDFPLGRDLSLSRCLCRPKARMARVRILFTDTALLRLSRIRIHGAKYSTTAKVSSIRVFRFENKTGLV